MQYLIKYDHISGAKNRPCANFYELLTGLNELDEDEWVINSSIEIITIKP